MFIKSNPATVIGFGFLRTLKSLQNTPYLYISTGAVCGNYKPELRGNNASKDPTNVARIKLQVI